MQKNQPLHSLAILLLLLARHRHSPPQPIYLTTTAMQYPTQQKILGFTPLHVLAALYRTVWHMHLLIATGGLIT